MIIEGRDIANKRGRFILFYGEMGLDETTHTLTVRRPASPLTFAGFFFLVGGVLGLGSIARGLLGYGPAAPWWVWLICPVFCLVGWAIIASIPLKLTLDRKAGTYTIFHGFLVAILRIVRPLNEIVGVQLAREKRRGRSGPEYFIYCLRLQVKGVEPILLREHGRVEKLEPLARKIQQFLGVPIQIDQPGSP